MNQQWYAIYTKKDAELKLRDCILRYAQENELAYDVYLPLKTEQKQWSDRKKIKESALFSNYLFVKHDDTGFSKIKTMPGFVCYVQFGQHPSVIPQAQIELIKTASEQDKNLSIAPQNLLKGDKVRIKSGALANQEGILLKDAQTNKVAIRVNNLKQYVQLSVPLDNIVLL